MRWRNFLNRAYEPLRRITFVLALLAMCVWIWIFAFRLSSMIAGHG